MPADRVADVEAAIAAAERALAAAQQLPPASGAWPVAAWCKRSPHGGQAVVSAVDVAVEAAILAAVAIACPTAQVLAEETCPDGDPRGAGLAFIVDPIDGTSELLAGRPYYAVSIAVTAAGRLEYGIVHYPAAGLTLRARRGRGATANHHPLRPRPPRQGRPLHVGVSPRQHALPPLRALAAGGPACLHPIPALTPKTGQVALGTIDCAVYLPVPGTAAHAWDYAAAALILKEAGRCLVSLADGTDLAASLPTTHTAGWYAGPADLYPQVSETITPSLSDMTQGAPA